LQIAVAVNEAQHSQSLHKEINPCARYLPYNGAIRSKSLVPLTVTSFATNFSTNSSTCLLKMYGAQKSQIDSVKQGQRGQEISGLRGLRRCHSTFFISQMRGLSPKANRYFA
jgi:hypothetical protein